MIKAENSENADKTNFAIVRNDFMLDHETQKWLQVEFNTLSSGLVHITDTVQEFQQALINGYLPDFVHGYEQFQSLNKELAGEAFLEALKIYNRPNAKVLYIVGQNEWNMYDHTQATLFLAKNGVQTIRKTFEELLQQATFESDGRFLVNEDEIGVVYWRWGYSPTHYYNEQIWELREKIELTRAIKCPNMRLILVNFKKTQMALQKNNNIENFLSNEDSEIVKQNFAQILDFQNEKNNEQVLLMAKQNPQNWVLKPQREGGGNNIYGTQIAEKLESMEYTEKLNYILMQRIKSIPRPGYMLTPQTFEMHGVISELSTWGYFIGTNDTMIANVQGGYLNRTKKYNENEGGLAVGLSVLDGLMIQKQ